MSLADRLEQASRVEDIPETFPVTARDLEDAAIMCDRLNSLTEAAREIDRMFLPADNDAMAVALGWRGDRILAVIKFRTALDHAAEPLPVEEAHE